MNEMAREWLWVMNVFDLPRWRRWGSRCAMLGIPALSALAVVMTLYFAPTKDTSANWLVLLLGVGIFVTHRAQWPRLAMLRPLVPLALLAAYAILLDWLNPGADATPLLLRLAIGAAVYAVFHGLFASLRLARRYLWLLFLFGAPALVHLMYMYVDIAVWGTAQDGVSLEYAKDAPRIGRRYLSHALIPLLFATWLLGPRLRPARWLPVVFLVGVGFPILSLALLDARAAYVAILGALGVAMVIAPLRRALGRSLRLWQLRVPGFHSLALLLLLATVLVAYAAGQSRWSAMGQSFFAALTDVRSGGATGAKKPPFADAGYWSRSIEVRCAENPTRCHVDQSMYLRTAWILHALRQLQRHPFGVGQQADLMSFGISREPGAADRSNNTAGDNFVIEAGLAFGYVGLALYAWFWWIVIRRGVAAVVDHRRKALYTLLTLLIGIGILRGFVDVMSFGLWYYWMGLVGVLYGCLQQDTVRGR